MSDEGPSTNSRRRPRTRRGATSTSAFGVGRREGHDASDFYARFAPPVVSSDDAVPDDPAVRRLDRVVHGSSTDMALVASGSVALVVTSPPYFAGKAYENELDAEHVPATYLEYLEMLREVFAECVRTLEPGGRIAVNVANLGRRPYRSLSADVVSILQDDLRLLLRGEIVWVKQRGASGSCAWGSFQRAANPVLRDLTERVVVASKGRFDRAVPQPERARRGLPSRSTMYRDEFMESTLDLWEIPPESARRVGHPAPFPVGLPERLINLYTYEGDLVLDPFMGSGSTAVAAVRTGRHFVGYDTDAEYVAAASERIAAARTAAGAAAPRPGVPSADGADDTADVDGDVVELAHRRGTAARDLAVELAADAGFARVEAPGRLAGVDVTAVLTDVDGRRLALCASGSFGGAGSGLRRPETLWRELGRASALGDLASVGAAGEEGLDGVVLVSVDLPTASSSAGRALAAALGAGTLLEVLGPDRRGREVLAQLAKGSRPGGDDWHVDGPLRPAQPRR